jgi:hypothetical protein
MGVSKWSSGGKFSRLAQAMYVYNDSDWNEGGKFRLMVYPSMVFDRSYAGRCRKG